MVDSKAGMKVCVWSTYGEACCSYKLDDERDNYVRGQVDVFDAGDAGDLGSCYNFRVPNHVSLIHLACAKSM